MIAFASPGNTGLSTQSIAYSLNPVPYRSLFQADTSSRIFLRPNLIEFGLLKINSKIQNCGWFENGEIQGESRFEYRFCNLDPHREIIPYDWPNELGGLVDFYIH